ncbi:hypothetical protein BDQ94DRAFT_53735 [Aspergillus welwitschiae]|uniref:Uncharacterized protein n=1 Tax=Aspergillus welwitschiae TaxID=1341132 RepID=A0A3F3PYH8_9EURO|nr:hypothetical protein BDQ94DRAFT_53735 [Aspergillus welwitschiae]RDH31969.1 hypothetical protein BDQ94DRAFT_53735 [Aspergillus welwitschiae]
MDEDNRIKRTEYERAADANICTSNVSVSQQMWNPREVSCMPAKGTQPARKKKRRWGEEAKKRKEKEYIPPLIE